MELPRDKDYLIGVAEIWGSNFALPESELANVRAGGYYSVQSTVAGLRVVSLNTLSCWNNAVPGLTNITLRDEMGAAQMGWLAGVLADTAAHSEKALIIGHIPPVVDSATLRPLWTQACLAPFTELLGQFGETAVAGLLFGHVHLDVFSVIRNAQGKPIGTALLVPSLTPRASTMPPMSGQNEGKHPSLRRFKLGKSRVLTDWEQWFVNLTEANAGRTLWRRSYSARNEYKMKDLSPKAFAALAERLVQNRDVFCTFLRHLTAEQPFPQCANAMCRRMLVCSASHSAAADVGRCMKSAPIPDFASC